MVTEIFDPFSNHLIASLPRVDANRILPSFKVVTLKSGAVLSEPGDEIDRIYFPHAGMISLLAIMKDGKAVETATVGREGVIGAMAGLGLHLTFTRAVVQIPVVASHISAKSFRKAVHGSDGFYKMILRYSEALLGQVQVTAACNAVHPLQARLARWILQTNDRVDDDIVPLTQELLSEMLGVRRSSVSQVASKLQATGAIRYSRGSIQITDRQALEAVSCECYHMLREQHGRLLHPRVA